jgi:hypothetical protein
MSFRQFNEVNVVHVAAVFDVRSVHVAPPSKVA